MKHRLLLTVCGLLPLLFWCGSAPSRETARPNFVFILADDLGWADIGYHGSDVMTPHLDQLASSGMRLQHHYVYPVCSPTRVGLLTGRGPSRFGVLTPLGSQQVLPHKLLTLPRALGQAGYRTHITGKWHIGSVPEARPLHYGFSTSYGYLRGQIDPYEHLYKNGDRTWHRNDKLLEEEGHVTDLITNEALRIISSAGEKPFLLYVAYSVPHYPLAEPSRWTGPYEGRIADPWRKRFAASITHMDDAIGQIIAALDRTGQRAKTLVIFVSDNGGQKDWDAPASQYHGKFKPHTTLGNNRPLRGWKGQLYEGGIRVPALANWPGHVPPGTVADDPISILDWMPTFCALAGRPVGDAAQLEGQNVWPVLTGRHGLPPRTLYWRTGRRLALRHGDWKLLTDQKLAHPQLYHLTDDPNEKHDRAAEYPDRVTKLTARLRQQRNADRGRSLRERAPLGGAKNHSFPVKQRQRP